MGLHVLLAELDTRELREDAVADITGILCLVGILVGKYAHFDEFGIGAEIKTEQVGTGFFEGGRELTHRRGTDPGQELS